MLLQFLRLSFAVLFTILFFPTSDWNILRAQERPGVLSSSATAKPADPPVPKRANLGASNRSTNVSLDGKKFLEFKQAIIDGNNARKKSDYVTAYRAYLHASELFPDDASSYYGLGNVYFDLYCYHSAIDFYSQAAKLKPNYFDALMQLGFAYSNKEQYDNAEAQFEAASRVNPKSIASKLARFYVLAKKGKGQEAIDDINKIINERSTANKDRAVAYITLGDVYVAQKKWQESIEPFQKATQLNPEIAGAFLRLGMSQLVSAFSKTPSSIDITMEDRAQLIASARQASETLRTAVEVKHFEHPAGYLVLGMAFTYQSNYQDAKSKLNAYLSKVEESENQLLKLDSNLRQKCDYAFGRLYADGYIQLGAVYATEARDAGVRKDELLTEAIKQYKNAVAAKQDHAGAYTSLGNAYVAQGRFREAVEEYEKSLLYESADTKAATYSVLGTVYAKLRSDSRAIDYLNKAIALAPTSSDYRSLALVYQNQENYDEAIRLGIKANDLEHTPKATSYYALALTYFLRAQTNNKNADFEEAIRLLNEAIKINKTSANLYLALGSVYKFYQNGAHLDQALANYNKAKDYDPQNAAIYFHLGDVHSSITHNYDAAIKYLTEAIRLKPDYAMAHWTLALAYREKKDEAAAIKQFLEGLKYEKSLNAYLLLSDIYDRQKNYAEAIKTLQEAVRLDPESHSAYLHHARVYTHQQNND